MTHEQDDTMTDQSRRPGEDVDTATTEVPGSGADPPTLELPVQHPSPGASILAQMGGWAGFVYTNVPAVVFSIANAHLPLLTTTLVALASAVALAVFRMAVRGEKLVPASGGILGVAIAGAVTIWTGSPRDFFLIGIWSALVAAVVLTASLAVRRPLTGVAWSWFHGRRFAWRDDRAVLRAHDLATLVAALVSGGRFALNQTLYLADSTGGLAAAKVVTGLPLTALMALVVVWAFRRSTRRLITAAPAPASS